MHVCVRCRFYSDFRGYSHPLHFLYTTLRPVHDVACVYVLKNTYIYVYTHTIPLDILLASIGLRHSRFNCGGTVLGWPLWIIMLSSTCQIQLCICMQMRTHVHMYTYMGIYVYIYMYIYIPACIYNTHTHMDMYIYIYRCVYTYTYIYM